MARNGYPRSRSEPEREFSTRPAAAASYNLMGRAEPTAGNGAEYQVAPSPASIMERPPIESHSDLRVSDGSAALQSYSNESGYEAPKTVEGSRHLPRYTEDHQVGSHLAATAYEPPAGTESALYFSDANPPGPEDIRSALGAYTVHGDASAGLLDIPNVHPDDAHLGPRQVTQSSWAATAYGGCVCDEVVLLKRPPNLPPQKEYDAEDVSSVLVAEGVSPQLFCLIKTRGTPNRTIAIDVQFFTSPLGDTPSDLVAVSGASIAAAGGSALPGGGYSGSHRCNKPVLLSFEPTRDPNGNHRTGQAWAFVSVDMKLCGRMPVIVVARREDACDIEQTRRKARQAQDAGFAKPTNTNLAFSIDNPDPVSYQNTSADRQRWERDILARMNAAHQRGGRLAVISSTDCAVEIETDCKFWCMKIHDALDCCCAYLVSIQLSYKMRSSCVGSSRSTLTRLDSMRSRASAALGSDELKQRVCEIARGVPVVCRRLEHAPCFNWSPPGQCPAEMGESLRAACGSIQTAVSQQLHQSPGNYAELTGLSVPVSEWDEPTQRVVCAELGLPVRTVHLLVYDLIGLSTEAIAGMVHHASRITMQCCVQLDVRAQDIVRRQIVNEDNDWWGFTRAPVQRRIGWYLVLIGPRTSPWVVREIAKYPGALGVGDQGIAGGPKGKLIALWGDADASAANPDTYLLPQLLAHELGHNAGCSHLGHPLDYVMGSPLDGPAASPYNPNHAAYSWTPEDCKAIRELSDG